jgi:hypothetical protein
LRKARSFPPEHNNPFMSERAKIRNWRIPHPGIEYAEDSFTWRVHDLDALGVAVKSLDQYCGGNALFRGQRNANWLLHSKYRRNMAKAHPPPSCECTTETQREWNDWHFKLVREYLDRFGELTAKFPDLAGICSEHEADLHFELHKASQQYADFAPQGTLSVGSNFVDFSKSYVVGLFFSAHDPVGEDSDEAAAIIVIDPTILNHIEEMLTHHDGQSQIHTEFQEDLDDRIPKADFPFYRVERYIPCARTQAQQASYLAQMDFRHCATVLWHLASEKMGRQHFCKIEYPADLKPAVLSYCSEQGVNQETMFPSDPFWKDKIQRIGMKL